MAEWNVAKSAGTCCVSGRKLEEGEEFYCALIETRDGFDRRDYAPEHWSGAPEDAFCFWKTRILPRQEKRRTFVDDDVLINFFLRLADTEDPVKENFRFVLAMILMRKRILKYEQTLRDNGQEFWQMRLVKEQSVHQVRNPRLDDNQIREVSIELGKILHSDMGEFDESEEADERQDDKTPNEPSTESRQDESTDETENDHA